MSESAIWNELGTLHLDAGSFDRAIEAYRKALEIDSAYGPAVSNLAMAQARQGNYHEAIPLYVRSLALLENDEKKAVIWNQLGNAYQRVTDYANALSAFQEAVSLAPDNEAYRCDLAAIRLEVEEQAPTVSGEGTRGLPGLVVDETGEQNVISGTPCGASSVSLAMLAQEQAVPADPDDLDAAPFELPSGAGLPGRTEESLPGKSEGRWSLPAEVPQVAPCSASPDLAASRRLAMTGPSPDSGPEQDAAAPGTHLARNVCIDEIFPNPLQPRLRVDVDDLVDSVREHGVLQPLLVTPGEGGEKYVLIAGERRLEAARQAGLDTVPVIVHAVDDQKRLELALIENVQRSNLSALELAEAYQCLAERFGLSHAEIAERMGKSRVSITNTLRLLRLPEDVKRALAGGRISEGHARALLSLSDESLQLEALQFVLRESFSVRQTEGWVRERSSQQVNAIPLPAGPVADPEPVASPATFVPAGQQLELPAMLPAGDLSLGAKEEEPVDEDDPGMQASPASEGEPSLEQDEEDLAVMMSSRLSLDVPPADPPVLAPAQAGESASPEERDEGSSSEPSLEESMENVAWMPLPAREPSTETLAGRVVEGTAVPMPDIPAVEQGTARQSPGPAGEVRPAPVRNEMTSNVRTSRSDTIYLQGVLSTYKRVTKSNPQNGPAWDTLGDLYCSLGQYEEAIAAFERAIAVNPEKDEYHYHLGTAYMVQKRYADAAVQFQETVRLNPECVYARSALASSYRHLGRDREAQEHIRIVAPQMELEKEYNRACFESIRGNVSKALEFLRQSIDMKQASLDQVRSDPDFDFLHNDPHFLALVGYPGYAS